MSQPLTIPSGSTWRDHPETSHPDAMELLSSAFANGDWIPRIHTVEGANLSPPLHWRHPPAGTRSFVLILDDPDAPPGHWIH